jgi:hypothetical protein
VGETHRYCPWVGLELWLHGVEELYATEDLHAQDEGCLHQDALQPTYTCRWNCYKADPDKFEPRNTCHHEKKVENTKFVVQCTVLSSEKMISLNPTPVEKQQ